MSSEPREYLIRKGGYYYRPNCAGYTTRKVEAGRYTKTEAEREAAVEPWHMSAIHQDEITDEPEVVDFKARVEALEAENARLAAALEPFANAARAYLIEELDDDYRPDWSPFIPYGAYRAARRAREGDNADG